MIGCILTVAVRVKSDWTQLEPGRKDEYTHVPLVGEDHKPEDEEEVEQRRCESTPSVQGQGLQGQVCACDPGGGG